MASYPRERAIGTKMRTKGMVHIPGGTFLMVDDRASSNLHENLDHPLGPFLYGVSTMHCMTVSLAQGGEGLGAMWGREQATAMLRAAGFGNVEVHNLPHDGQNCYYVCRV